MNLEKEQGEGFPVQLLSQVKSTDEKGRRAMDHPVKRADMSALAEYQEHRKS